MSGHHVLIIGFLAAASSTIACEDELARDTERAAERVMIASNRLQQGLRELETEAAERSEDLEEITGAVVDVTRHTGAYAQALQDFEDLRALRVKSLELEHSVAASQPLLVETIAQAKTLSPAQRARLDENLAIFRERLAGTRILIEQLQYASAATWEYRDDEVAHAMAGMFIARDASWQALDEAPGDDRFPRT